MGLFHVEGFRIEGAAGPAAHGFVFLVARIAPGCEESLIAMWAADIFRRATAGTVNELWIRLAFRHRDLAPESDPMAPAVAEIIFVEDLRRGDAMEHQVGEPDVFGFKYSMIQKAIAVELRRADDKAAQNELVQMRVGLAERGLDNLMQLGEVQTFRHKQRAPDRRRNVGDGYGDAPSARRVEIDRHVVVRQFHGRDHGAT